MLETVGGSDSGQMQGARNRDAPREKTGDTVVSEHGLAHVAKRR